MKKLTQEIFKNQPSLVDWCGVDYDGLLRFGQAIYPRYTWAGERWQGFIQIGEGIKNSGFKPLTSLRRKESKSINYIQMKIKFNPNWSVGKAYTAGSVVGRDSEGREMQKVIDTIYYLGYLRLIVTHKNKLKRYS